MKWVLLIYKCDEAFRQTIEKSNRWKPNKKRQKNRGNKIRFNEVIENDLEQ